MSGLILIAIIIGIILYYFYVKVIKCRNRLNEALSGIDVQLEKRYDLVPNILKIAKEFMEHEQEIFTQITELRTRAMNAPSGSKEKFSADNELTSKLDALKVSVENYPELKSNDTMVQAMKTYEETEENIAAARRFYNTALRQLHDAIMIFPGSLFAGCAGDISQFSYFEAEESHKKPINADDYLR